jgi:hypothetical protein
MRHWRLKEWRRARRLQLRPGRVGEELLQLRLGAIVERQYARPLQLDLFTPIVLDDPRLKREGVGAGRSRRPDEEVFV